MEPGPPIERVAQAMWEELCRDPAARPPSPRATLVLTAGVPLAGKTAPASAMARAARTATLHVENDTVRPRVAAAMGRAAPRHDGPEQHLTYRAAWALARRALQARWNAVHDATNLNEPWRRGAYELADALGALGAVVFVLAPPEVLAERAARDPARREAFERLGDCEPAPRASRPFLLLDDARAIAENLEHLRAWRALDALSRPAGPWG